MPCNHTDAGKKHCWSHVFYSDDHGKTWQLGGSLPDDHTSEPELVELVDGTLMMNTRNWPPREAHRRAVSLSRDGGLTWSQPYHDQALITPHCQGSIRRLTAKPPHDKNRILFVNPASTQKRERLTIRLSYDEGKSWPVSRLIYAGGSAYSCLVVLPDGSIGCLFEKDDCRRLTLVRITLEELTDGADSYRPMRRLRENRKTSRLERPNDKSMPKVDGSGTKAVNDASRKLFGLVAKTSVESAFATLLGCESPPSPPYSAFSRLGWLASSSA